MTRTRTMHLALPLALALLSTAVAHSGELPGRASLAELHAIGHIIVTVAAGSNGDEAMLRRAIEERLESAGTATDPMLDTQLVADVSVAHDTSPSGQRYFLYRISLSLQEPVRTERIPRTTFRGTTWSSSATVRRFGVDIPFQTILDAVENKMSDFLTAVSRDTAALASTGR